MQPQQIEFMPWLQAMLTDKNRRAILRALLEQHELPVIEIGQTANRQGWDAPRHMFQLVSSDGKFSDLKADTASSCAAHHSRLRPIERVRDEPLREPPPSGRGLAVF